jgi:hypothetical protein
MDCRRRKIMMCLHIGYPILPLCSSSYKGLWRQVELGGQPLNADVQTLSLYLEGWLKWEKCSTVLCLVRRSFKFLAPVFKTNSWTSVLLKMWEIFPTLFFTHFQQNQKGCWKIIWRLLMNMCFPRSNPNETRYPQFCACVSAFGHIDQSMGQSGCGKYAIMWLRYSIVIDVWDLFCQTDFCHQVVTVFAVS